MMTKLGWTVHAYGSDVSEGPFKSVTCISRKQQQKLGFNGPDDYLKIQFNANLSIWKTFNANVIKRLKVNLKPKDIICFITGLPVIPIAEAFPNHLNCEVSIGYSGVFSDHRVFESYAWQNYIQGLIDGHNGTDSDFRAFDAVIPNPIVAEDFPMFTQKDDYFLYIGRLIDRKGYRIAVDVCKKLGLRLKIAGQGIPPDYGEYLGTVGIKERAELMGRARAVFVPTQYLGPFETVNVEAQMAGTPVITTNFGCFSETVEHELTGFRCNTYLDFINATKKVDSLDYQYIHDRAYNLYSTNAVGPMYEKYFNRLLTLWKGGYYDLDG